MASEPRLADHLTALQLPLDLCDRTQPEVSAAVDQLMADYDAQVSSRAFLTGLLLAFVSVAEELLTKERRDSVADVLSHYQRQTLTARGGPVNTLNIIASSGTVHLRPHYNAVEGVIRGKLRRYGYPSAAPHATQAWPQHESELRRVCALSPGERRLLAERLWERVLALPEFAARSPAQMTVRPFSEVLRDFPNTQTGEKPGALLQGLAYAYYRADAPNVTLEVRGSRTGSARLGGVGDIDGWSGATLALSIEVKDALIAADNPSEFNSFLVNLREHTDATAIALARTFAPEAKVTLEQAGLLVMDRERMASNVALWDLRKQQVAVQALEYYLSRIERDPKLLARFREFVEDNNLPIG